MHQIAPRTKVPKSNPYKLVTDAPALLEFLERTPREVILKSYPELLKNFILAHPYDSAYHDEEKPVAQQSPTYKAFDKLAGIFGDIEGREERIIEAICVAIEQLLPTAVDILPSYLSGLWHPLVLPEEVWESAREILVRRVAYGSPDAEEERKMITEIFNHLFLNSEVEIPESIIQTITDSGYPELIVLTNAHLNLRAYTAKHPSAMIRTESRS